MARYPSALLLALFALAVPSPINADCTQDQVNNDEDIVSIVCSSENEDTFGTLCDLLRETNIDATISTSSDYFLFAPDNTAFSRAGNRAGHTIGQKQAVLQYHISNDDSDLVCGASRDSLLSVNGVTQSSVTRCNDDEELAGQEGNANIPSPSSSFPRFADADDFIEACNGVIAQIGDVMGWGPAVYSYGSYHTHRTGCSFYSKSCKGSKGGYAMHTHTVNGVVFDSIYYNPRVKSRKGWRNFNRHQSVYAHNGFGAFYPYAHHYRPYYNSKHHKGSKGRYYRTPRANQYYNDYYFGGYHTGPRGRGFWNRDLEGDENSSNGSLRGHFDEQNEEN